jgi:antitoxin component YwqK of YwqJK toxin-antitoxin module
MKQKIYLALVLINISISCFSQGYKFVYYLDKDLASTKKSDAIFVGKGKTENGKFKLDCFNKEQNHLIMTIHFTDSSVSEMNGSFASFYVNGVLENEGNYVNSLEDGIWIKRDTIGLIIDSSFYEKGIKYSYAKFEYYRNKQKSSYQYTDSLKRTYYYVAFDSTGTKVSEANFIDSTGVYNVYDSTGAVNSTNVFTRTIIEAECPNYKNHLLRNLNADVGLKKGIKSGRYTVIVKFIIDINGAISGIVAETNHGYGLEEEALRVIRISPKWIPASIFGIPAKSIRRQPISFYFAGDE